MPLLADLHRKRRRTRPAAIAGQQYRLFRPVRRFVARPGPRLFRRLPGGPECRSGWKRTARSRAARRWRPSVTAPADVRDTPIAELWATHPALQFNRNRGVEDLWGFCRDCYYRRGLPRRLHLDGGFAARPARQQSVLPSPCAEAGRAWRPRAHREDRGRRRIALRDRTLRTDRRTDPDRGRARMSEHGHPAAARPYRAGAWCCAVNASAMSSRARRPARIAGATRAR